jgi:hypothetical protein
VFQTPDVPTRSLVNVPTKLLHFPLIVGTRREHRTCLLLDKVFSGKEPGQMNYKIHYSETNSALNVSSLYTHTTA